MIEFARELEKVEDVLEAAIKLLENDKTITSLCSLRRKLKLTETYLRSLCNLLPNFRDEVRETIRKNNVQSETFTPLVDRQANYLEKNLVTILRGIEKGLSFNDFEIIHSLPATTMKKYLPFNLLVKIRANGEKKTGNFNKAFRWEKSVTKETSNDIP